MANQYDLVADQYDLSFQMIPYRLHIEAYSVYDQLGDITGKSVVDLATGTGFYARALKKHGADRVVGVELSEQMVGIAQMAEQANPLGITYHLQDVTQFKADAPFDVALAVYLLHYNATKEGLEAMCQAIADNLKPGGRFITYILNPDVARKPGYYQPMGLNIHIDENTPPRDGEALPFSVILGDMTMPEVTAYRWEKETVNQALSKAGFTDVQWIAPTLSPEGEAQYDKAYFESYLKQPHAVLLTCVKA